MEKVVIEITLWWVPELVMFWDIATFILTFMDLMQESKIIFWRLSVGLLPVLLLPVPPCQPPALKCGSQSVAQNCLQLHQEYNTSLLHIMLPALNCILLFCIALHCIVVSMVLTCIVLSQACPVQAVSCIFGGHVTPVLPTPSIPHPLAIQHKILNSKTLDRPWTLSLLLWQRILKFCIHIGWEFGYTTSPLQL